MLHVYDWSPYDDALCELALYELRAEQALDQHYELEAETIAEYLDGWELGCDEREDPWYGVDPVRF